MQCEEHPQSPGIGICVSCSCVVCAACTTRLQGRNFCARCLQRRAPRGKTPIARSSGLFARRFVGLLLGIGTLALLGSLSLLGYFLHRMG
jgi:hypothetical protein